MDDVKAVIPQAIDAMGTPPEAPAEAPKPEMGTAPEAPVEAPKPEMKKVRRAAKRVARKVRPLIHGADDAEMRVRLPRDESKKPPDLRREVFV